MVNIEPSDAFKEEVQSHPLEVPAAPPTPPPNPSVPPAPVSPGMPISQLEANTNTDIVKTTSWTIESVFINIFALIIVGSALLGIIQALLSNSSSGTKFFLVLLYGIPGLLGFFLLRRSSMARLVITVFMVLNIATQFIPGATINPTSLVISLVVIIFLNTHAIKRHFE